MIKVGANIAEIEGRVGGDIYRKDVCGQHIQKTPRLVKKNSPAQTVQRRAFLKAMSFCHRKNLTFEEWDSWWLYTVMHPITNKKGKRIILEPCQKCMSINIYRALNDLPMIKKAPE